MVSAQASEEQPRRRGRRPGSQAKPEPNDESLEVCSIADNFDHGRSPADASVGIETAAAEPQSTAAISFAAASCSCRL